MHDLKHLAANSEAYRAAFIARGGFAASNANHYVDVLVNRYPTRNRYLELRDQAYAAMKAHAKARGDNLEGKALRDTAEKLDRQVDYYNDEIASYLNGLPNLPATDEEVGDWMDWETPGPDPKTLPQHGVDHTEILDKNQLDFEVAAKIAGTRFAVLKGDLATMERHLANDMIDFNIAQGYKEVSVPLLVNEASMFGTGQLPKFENDLFKTTDDRYLIPTAEVPLTNLVRDAILDVTDAPMRLTALTPCFRSEAGSAGRDTKGLIRQHQFYKAELVSICTPDQAGQEFHRMMVTVSNMLTALNLPFRIVKLPPDDLGFSAKLTYDFEVWFPGQKAWREVSSVSWCGEFQARRMNARFKEPGKKPQFLHTLNGSCLAVGRILAALTENHYETKQDG